jgi:hypothetical protein
MSIFFLSWITSCHEKLNPYTIAEPLRKEFTIS